MNTEAIKFTIAKWADGKSAVNGTDFDTCTCEGVSKAFAMSKNGAYFIRFSIYQRKPLSIDELGSVESLDKISELRSVPEVAFQSYLRYLKQPHQGRLEATTSLCY